MKRTLDFSLTCCFTGHRVIPPKDIEPLKKALSENIDNLITSGVRRFICGGALGFDTLAAQAVLEKKKEHDLILEIAVPCKGQESKWNKTQKAKYNEILASADEVTVLFEKYVTGCMHFRDAFMVDNSDIIICYYRGRPGGTQYTYLYAQRRGLKIINL